MGAPALSRVTSAACIAALFGSAGCATAAPPMVMRAPSDDAVEIAQLLPATADRCTLARPGLVADRRRPLLLHASHSQGGDLLAWSREPRVAAYASARHVDDDGRRTTVTVVRLAEPLASARERLRDALPIRVRFADEACRDDECDLPIAEILDERTVRIVRGRPPRSERGVSPCVRLALDHPTAVEIAIEAVGCTSPDDGGACAMRRIITTNADGIRVRQEMVMVDEARAAQLAESMRIVGEETGITRVSQHGVTVVATAEQRWTDLELALEDERIERAATARRAGAMTPLPLDRVDISRLPLVHRQVELRDGRLARLSGGGREAAARDLATLLERAFEAHPTALDLAHRLARLRLDDLSDPRGAAELADRILAGGLGERDPWHSLRREALVAQLSLAPDHAPSLARAAAALQDDGIAPDERSARSAARDLAALRPFGVRYELAESAWTYARARALRVVPLAPLAPGSGAPLAAIPATLAWLAELEGEPGPFSVFVLARGNVAEGVRALEADRAGGGLVMRLDGAADAPIIAGSAASTEGLLHIGALLESALTSGPVTLDVVLTSLSTPGRERAVRLEGELGVGRMRIDRADAWGARRDWLAVERYLADPLRTLGTRLFPPADLVVIAHSHEEAVHLAEIGSEQGGVTCAASALEVRCAPRPDADARGALRRIARAALFGPRTSPGQ